MCRLEGLSLFTRLIFYIIGLLILSLGVSLTLLSGLGIGSWEAFNIGLSITFEISITISYTISGILLVAINSILTKNRPDVLALVTTFLIGFLVDFWSNVIELDTFLNTYEFISIFIFILGILITSTGISIYLQSKFAASPVDNFMMTIMKLTGWSIKYSKIATELIGLVLAFFFSGPIGIGTLLFVILLGPLIEVQYNFINKKIISSFS